MTRKLLLSGRSSAGVVDLGPTICACYGVPQSAIEAAIRGGATSPEAIGQQLKAGTNCGSCIPEMKRLIASSRPARQEEQPGALEIA